MPARLVLLAAKVLADYQTVRQASSRRVGWCGRSGVRLRTGSAGGIGGAVERAVPDSLDDHLQRPLDRLDARVGEPHLPPSRGREARFGQGASRSVGEGVLVL